MRAQYVPTRELRGAEIAYIAGIIDGEGTIGVYKGGAPYSYSLRLIVSNTHVPMLEWLHVRVGGSLTRNGTGYKTRHKQGWQVVLWQAHAAAVIQACRPFLIVKAPQADLGLRFMSEFISHRGRPVTDEEIRRRQWYFEQTHLLNGLQPVGRRRKSAQRRAPP